MKQELLPHQQRVLDEQVALDIKIAALDLFIESDKFATLDVENQELLAEQLDIMISYSEVLGKRIRLFYN